MPTWTSAEYEAAIRRMKELFPALVGSPASYELDALAEQVERYEHQFLKAVLPPPKSVWLQCTQCGEGEWHDPIPGDESPEGTRCEACMVGIRKFHIL